MTMSTYRKMHNAFFFECAFLRNKYGIAVLTFQHIESGRWLSMDEIADFTRAYMMGGEL
jgi:hypothetical protein